MSDGSRDADEPERLELTPEQGALFKEFEHLIQYAAYEAWSRYKTLELWEYESEAFIAMFGVVLGYDPSRGRFESYARPRLRGALIDALRKLQPAVLREGAAGDAPRPASVDAAAMGPTIPMDAVIDPVTTMESTFAREELREVALAVMDDLSPELRAIARAVYIEGISLRQYALRTGMGIKTVQRRHRDIVDVLVPRVLRGG